MVTFINDDGEGNIVFSLLPVTSSWMPLLLVICNFAKCFGSKLKSQNVFMNKKDILYELPLLYCIWLHFPNKLSD